MFNIVSTFVVATFFAVATMYVNKLNKTGLSLRGRRTLFIAAVLIGVVLAQVILHVFYDCDAQNVCRYVWHN